jgi:hypothetical protein
VKNILCVIGLFLSLATPAFADTVSLQELAQSVHGTSNGRLISIFSGNMADGEVVGVVQADNTTVTTLAISSDGQTLLATELSVANLVCDLTREWSAEGATFLCIAL